MTRKRRILIAALAVVGILFVYSNRSATEWAFFCYLYDHPAAANAVGTFVQLVGAEEAFDIRHQELIWEHVVEKQRKLGHPNPESLLMPPEAP